jgi:hypothetical protein
LALSAVYDHRSSGRSTVPIDGTSDVSRKLDAVFGSSRPGRVLVIRVVMKTQ